MWYDVYGLSLERNEATIERFLKQFCDRDLLDPLEETWLHTYPNEDYNAPEIEAPLRSIAELIDYAVRNLNYCFVFYNRLALRPEIRSLILKFTWDSKVVFGISIEEMAYDGTNNYSQACVIETEIKSVTHAYKSFIAAEYSPPNDEEEFDSDMYLWRDIGDNYR